MRRCRFSSLPCRASLRQLRQPPRYSAGKEGLALVAVDESVLGPALSGSPRETGLSFHIFTAISR